MPCIIWNTSTSATMKLPWRYQVKYTNEYFLSLWSRCVKEFEPFHRSGLNAQSEAGSCNSCKSWRRRMTTHSSCTRMRNFSLIRERMLTTWWVAPAVAADQPTGGRALLGTLILCAREQEYVFEGEDGHTEIMPVSHFTWCCLMCNLFIASFVYLDLLYCILTCVFATQVWTPPTPPQDDNDIYIDSVMMLMYDTTPIPESKLPPVYIRKEHKRLKMDPSGKTRLFSNINESQNNSKGYFNAIL